MKIMQYYSSDIRKLNLAWWSPYQLEPNENQMMGLKEWTYKPSTEDVAKIKPMITI